MQLNVPKILDPVGSLRSWQTERFNTSDNQAIADPGPQTSPVLCTRNPHLSRHIETWQKMKLPGVIPGPSSIQASGYQAEQKDMNKVGDDNGKQSGSPDERPLRQTTTVVRCHRLPESTITSTEPARRLPVMALCRVVGSETLISTPDQPVPSPGMEAARSDTSKPGALGTNPQMLMRAVRHSGFGTTVGVVTNMHRLLVHQTASAVPNHATTPTQ